MFRGIGLIASPMPLSKICHKNCFPHAASIQHLPTSEATRMQVRISHQQPDGSTRDMGMRELSHMPPIGEPFPLDEHTSYLCKAYFGPDEKGLYLLVLEGEAQHSERPIGS
jgi:hypothetical protein